MRVPLLDLKAQLATIEAEVKGAVLRVVDSTSWILGPEVEALERDLERYLDTPAAVGVSSGSDALIVSLMALGVGPGDRVITSPFSFFASAGCIARLGATPVFVDIDPRTYNISGDALREWFEAHRADADSVKAILPVHIFGQCADLDPILDLAEARGIPVIEDAAQAIGSRYASRRGARMAGTFGKLGCFSFFPSKNLGGIGDGGLVVTADGALADKLRQLRAHGSKPKYYHGLVGGNFRLDPIQAAVLRVKLAYLDGWIAARQQKAAIYNQGLAGSVTTPHCAVDATFHTYHQYVIATGERDRLEEHLTSQGIGNAIYYPRSLHEQECFSSLGYKRGDFPNSEWAADHTLALPIYPELSSAMQDFVIEQIRAAGSGRATPEQA